MDMKWASPPKRNLRKSSLLPFSTPLDHGRGANRLLITVNVLGSAGPIRFVAREEDLVASVISVALRYYAREGRLPVLGTDHDKFILHCANAGSDGLSPMETIGSLGSRNFTLCRKLGVEDHVNKSHVPAKKSLFGGWKSWLTKSMGSRASSH